MRLIQLMIIGLLFTGCAFAPWEKPMQKDTPEETVHALRERIKENPQAVTHQKDWYLAQDKAVLDLLVQAEMAKRNGNFADAKTLYEHVLSITPDHPSAMDGMAELQRESKLTAKLQRAEEMNTGNQLQLAKELVHEVLLEKPNDYAATNLDNELRQKSEIKTQPPQLKPPFEKPVSLELRDANIKVVFEALSRATGINFILDKDIKPDTKATIFIKKMPIDTAIDMVLASNGLQKKALSENTAVVFPATSQKLKDYQDLMIRSFYFTNTTAKQVAVMLKTMLKTKDIHVDERLNMLVMRDTPEVIRIAEKLVKANDIADPEVMLDIEVLEVNRNRLQELGIVYPNQLAVIGADTGLTLEKLKSIKSGDILVSPNPAVNFKKTTGDTNVLSNPRIRVKNNEKAKILVGDKVPIITTTATANVGISENVQYVDVGLKLDVEPRISLDDFVNIKVGLEVSSLGERTVTRNGAVVFTIGTRNANTVLRLRSGETQILAGLILDDERKNATKLPGLGDIPILGRLFSNQEDRKSKTEIVLAITPRVLGNIYLPDAEVSEYWSGTETQINDRPQLILPAGKSGNGPLTPTERLRELRARQVEQEESSQEPVPQPNSEVPTQSQVEATPKSEPSQSVLTAPQPLPTVQTEGVTP